MMMVLSLKPGLKVKEGTRSSEHAEDQDAPGGGEEV